jgi:23S rRNA (guanosine2251-2'-O)-methyltransferase
MQTIYGIRSVIETIEAGKTVEKVIIKKGTSGDLIKELLDLVKDKNIHFIHAHADRFLKFRNKNHQGVVAYVSAITYQQIDDVIQNAFENGEHPLVLICDGITDVRNFGAIVRSAECFGAHAVVMPSKGSASINADAIKTSAGALNTLPICKSERLSDTIKYLKNAGLKVIAATEKADKRIDQLDLNMPLAVILGNEGEGVSEKLIQAADEQAKIPMLGKIASLNVSVSAGVILYETLRQRL